MQWTLNTLEQRVLGVLMEKALAQPDYYPMTVNAVTVACNQKNNRDPVMDLDEVAVLDTLNQLQSRGLVSLIMPSPGARVNRYRHELDSKFGWQPRERAIMTELLLRGPQTIGELRNRSSRFLPFENPEAITTVLEVLEKSNPPWVRALPRVPGQSAIRYTHLLFDPAEQPLDRRTGEPVDYLLSPAASSVAAPDEHTLRDEVEHLHAEVAAMWNEIADLKRQIDELRSRG
ncbi:MAG: hypothetical protein HJJLKODD_02746 [Phycisphaerae bacterium]|nr:hypothetical protein [Phycisphaerae bacterium]